MYTVDQVATMFGVEKQVAYGFLKFLATKGLIDTDKETREPGQKGKSATLYKFDKDVVNRFVTFMDTVFAMREVA